ncbi:cytochrome d ubiquinol oxidase subunit II [Lawsonella clevelandensis]|uniref:Cytochrome C oxidase assembly protein n=1 Tax=Lawsonella clevelandensis TaxID=1528099 RepID=A0A0M4N064_9ACTN|nr:cytochrome d ubiquinol oxidase subunit II [Lawsonella clevelandensis]ALE19223.1 cytochrome C oxidase assembly protein [Lawsonella clevelandensis]ALE34885.1 cytochrome C oxidase assembly protein [Lawsonella clevelandensis]MDU7193326.1 cytochrome d ubiquinol oxidase subunit II [Lawsonella clevelandensis]VHO01178.1 Cytochrome bd-I ubiquinol oxidase subunit 2 [Lawsonella clevelandensis]
MELQITWFVLVAVLFLGYFVLEGFDFGVGILSPFVSRHDNPDVEEKKRRVVLNTIGPHWDGNEVWLLTGGGALFASFPQWYATMFSGFYLALFLILLALIWRNVSIEFRGKIEAKGWRKAWDIGFFVGSLLPALLWGVAFANIVQGVDIDANKNILTPLWGLLNPYGLLGGLATLLLFTLHGGIFMALKTDGIVRESALKAVRYIAIPTIIVVAAFGLWTQLAHGKGWTWAALVIAALALIAAVALAWLGKEAAAFGLMCLTIAGVVVLLFGALYPYLMPSTLEGGYSLTIFNSSSTQYTLTVMTIAAGVMTPIVIAYQAWTFWVFRKRLTTALIPDGIGLEPAS